MKEIKKILLIIITISIILFLQSSAEAELSNNDYAVGVVLNSQETTYNLYNLDKLKDLTIRNNKYITPSEYDSRLAAVLSYESGLIYGKSEGLSVRLQLPTKIQETNVPYLKFSSTIVNRELAISGEKVYNGWEIICSNYECSIKKQRTTITIIQDSKNRYEITLETSDNLDEYAGAKCFSKFSNTLCITENFKKDLEDVLSYTELISSFNSLFSNYNIINVGNRLAKTLVKDTTLNPDWKEAMRQQLVGLKKKGIISMPDSEVEQIVNLTEQGKAGKNSRIIYDDNIQAYNYYYKTNSPILTQEIDTAPFEFPIKENTAQKTITNLYYLIPIIFTLILLTLFIILITIAKIMTRKKKKRAAKRLLT